MAVAPTSRETLRYAPRISPGLRHTPDHFGNGSEISNRYRRKAFEVTASTGKTLLFPDAKLDVRPSLTDKVVSVFMDAEIGREAFTYRLESDRESSVHIDQVLEYNEDRHIFESYSSTSSLLRRNGESKPAP